MKECLHAIIVAALCLLTTAAFAGYPDKPVTIVVNFAAGGPLDAVARIIAEQASGELKQPFIVDNKPGAGGNIGAAAVAKAAPDGYTLLVTLDSLLTINPALYPSMPFDAKKAFDPVAMIGTFSQTLAVNPKVAAKTLPELFALAKTKDLTYASAGNGSPGHLTFEYLMQTAGVKMTHVPYKGAAPAILDLVGGQVDAGFLVTSGVLPHVQAGKLRAIAVSGNERVPQLPSVPTIAESGVRGFDVRFAFILLVPAGTPAPIVKLLHDQVARALERTEVRQKLLAMDIQPVGGAAGEVDAWIGREAARWLVVIRTAGVKVD